MGGKIEAGHAPIPTFASGLKDVPIFVVSGLSKIAGLPQMKAAWIVAAGPGPQRGAALDRLEVIADTFLSMNAPVQWALPAWLSGRHGIQRQIQERVWANLAELDRQLAAHSALAAPATMRAAGTPCCAFRLCARMKTPSAMLLDCGVWVHPGYFFGLPDSGWLVLSLLAPVDEFQTGMEALINFLGTNQEPNKFKG